MRRHLLGRSLRCLASAFVVLSVNFFLPRLMPGDPVVHLLGTQDYYRFPEMAERLKARYGLDRPLSYQYGQYWIQLARGDLGYSFTYGRPVAPLVLHRLGWTLALVGPGLALGAVAALIAGAWGGWHAGRWSERLLTGAMLLVKSTPEYGLAMLASMVLAFHWGFFPLGGVASGGGQVAHAALPVLVLGLLYAGQYYLVLRNTVAGLRGQPAVTAARGRGATQTRALAVHVLPQALPPFISLVGLGLGFAVSGALLVEIVFSWPGMGTLLLEAVETKDYPVLQACLVLLTVSVLLANYLTDLAYGWLDPRVRRP